MDRKRWKKKENESQRKKWVLSGVGDNGVFYMTTPSMTEEEKGKKLKIRCAFRNGPVPGTAKLRRRKMREGREDSLELVEKLMEEVFELI